MRLDPNVLMTVGQVCVIGVVTTAAANMVASPSLSLTIFVAGGALSLGAVVRGFRSATHGLGGEKLATSLTDEMRAVLEAPPPQLPPAQPSVEGNATQDELRERLAAGGCPRCPWGRLGVATGDWQQRDCTRGCGALVLDSERLLTERAGLDLEVVRALVKEQGVKKGICPSCAAGMFEGRLRGVVVDLCLSCGATWLDKGELAVLSREGAFGGVA